SRRREATRPYAERLRPLFAFFESNRDDRHRSGIVRRAGNRLDDSENDHGGQVPSEPGQDRPENKNSEAQNINFLAANGVAQLTPDRHEDSVGQDVSRGYPARRRNGDVKVVDD